MSPTDRLHAAARALLCSLATGFGDAPELSRRDLLASPEVQELSDAADAMERDDG